MRLSSSSRPLLVIVFSLLLVNTYVVNAQNSNNTNTSNVNSAANNNTNVNANSNTNTNANTNTNQNQNTNDNTGKNAEQNPPGKWTLAKLFESSWYAIVVSLLFGFLVIGFGYVIMRAIRFSKFTFNNPLGLPDGSLRAVLAFLLVSFLGFYVFASVLNGSELKIPDSLLGIIATVIGFYFGSRTTEPKGGNTGSVQGTVVNNAGSAAAGATIELTQAGKKFTQTADLNGKFKFENVPIGEYEIQASLTGQNPSDQTKVKVTADGSETVNLKLK